MPMSIYEYQNSYMLFSNSLRQLPGNVILTDIQLDRVRSIYTKFLGLCIDDGEPDCRGEGG